jgi:uncharacterized damage-inducible protein DinB
MSTKEALVKEFKIRVFEESYTRIFKCLSLIDNHQLWESPNEKIPPIGNLVLHLCGNARQWIISGIGGDPDNRSRDEEFEIQRNIRKADLIFLLENVKVNLNVALKNMNENELFERKVIQGFETTFFSAIIHVIEHFSYHTGQITTITKWLRDEETFYYGSLDLNKKN